MMLTYTGRSVDILNPTEDMIDIIDIAHSLSNQCRFTGHTLSFYSVAEHSVRLSGRFLTLEDKRWALMHDAAEAYISDIATPVKHLPEVHAVIAPIEERFLRVIASKFELPWPMPECVHEEDVEEGYHEYMTILFQDDSKIGWTPEKAEKEFMMKFTELFG